jgi:hypothetical protein
VLAAAAGSVSGQTSPPLPVIVNGGEAKGPPAAATTPAPGPTTGTCVIEPARASRSFWHGREPEPAPVVTAAPSRSLSGFWQTKRAEGVARRQAKMWGYPEEFEAQPFGASVHAPFEAMVANGTAASMVLYHFDFIDGSDMLNVMGRDRLHRIACLMAENDFPVIIQRTPEAPALAEARRTAVLTLLAQEGLTVPMARVVIGPPIANGLAGFEGMRTFEYHILNHRIQAQPIPPPTLGPGSTTGGGSGGR